MHSYDSEPHGGAPQAWKDNDGAARLAHCCRAWKFKELLSVAMKCTSRILVGLMAFGGLDEPREGIGCWVCRGELIKLTD
jgi:hypothetical protein